MKYLVALQYWEGDRDDAIKLMEMLSQTVQEANPWADFVVWYRFDTTPPNASLIEALQAKFARVYVLKGPEQITGYPEGCNALWAGLVMKAYRMSTESVRGRPMWEQYKAVLAIESDTSPNSDDWLEVISKEWDLQPVAFMGAWIEINHDHKDIGHINGNAMFAMDLAKRIPMIMGTPCFRAWDTYHAPALKAAGWHCTNVIASWFRHKNLTLKELRKLRKGGCVLLHGIKGSSTRDQYLMSRFVDKE